MGSESIRKLLDFSLDEGKSSIRSIERIVKNDNEYDLSVIIPCYNSEKYIEKCIDSVLHQNNSNIQYIFVDDGSTDNTLNMLEKYRANENFIVLSEENGGASKARNLGLEYATGKYVTFLDSDDILPENALNRLLNVGMETDADLVEGALVDFVNENEIKDREENSRIESEYENVKDIKTGYVCGKLYRNSLFNRLCFPEGYWYEDTIVSFLIVPLCQKIVYVPKTVYFYRRNPEGMTAVGNKSNKTMDTLWIARQCIADYRELGLPEDDVFYKKVLAQITMNYVRTSIFSDEIQRYIFDVCKDIITDTKNGNIPTGKMKVLMEKAILLDSFELYKEACELDWKASLSGLDDEERVSPSVLLYRWGSNSEKELISAFHEAGVGYIEFKEEMKDYHADSDFSLKLIEVLNDNPVKAIMSFDYFPLLSMICEIRGIKYISWIYDCPQLTLESKTLTNACNYIFCFDRMYAERLSSVGAMNCYHMPLGANVKDIDFSNVEYNHSISFVGNLYTEDKNRIRKALKSNAFDEYTKGYLDALILSQKKIYGANLIKPSLSEDIVSIISNECALMLGEFYRQDTAQLVTDAINMEVSAQERIEVLALLGDNYSVDLYSGSKMPSEFNNKKIKNNGYVDYDTKMGEVFNKSKINLNITSRSIESGIPLRVFDILANGGFCLTNYQVEIAELFTDGEEIVMYSDYADLLAKVDYYLSHEEERKEIAINGYKAVKERFSLVNIVKDIMKISTI